MEKYYPKKMRVMDDCKEKKKQLKDIEVLVEEDGTGRQSWKFNLQQTWMLQSPSTYRDAYGFRRALMGDNSNSPSCELSVLKYPSLVFVNYNSESSGASAKDSVKCKPFMNADDVVKFLLSDFARRGQYDEIFEKDGVQAFWNGEGCHVPKLESACERGDRGEPSNHCARVLGGDSDVGFSVVKSEWNVKSEWKGPPELVQILEDGAVSSGANVCGRLEDWHDSAKHATAQGRFMRSCLARVDSLQTCFRERASIAADGCCERQKKRKTALASTAVQNMASILLDANAMLYDEALEGDRQELFGVKHENPRN